MSTSAAAIRRELGLLSECRGVVVCRSVVGVSESVTKIVCTRDHFTFHKLNFLNLCHTGSHMIDHIWLIGYKLLIEF